MAESPDSVGKTQAGFPQTQWSVVIAAGGSGSAAAEAALEKLCSIYWPPLYATIRRHGYTPAQAEDLTQDFFAHFLQKHAALEANPEKGRFRSLLSAMLKRFLINAWHRENSQKRGGGTLRISLDTASVEARYQLEGELADMTTPESLFEQHWAFTVLELTKGRLRQEYHENGKAEVFDLLQETLAGRQRNTPRDELAARFGISPAAVDAAVYRLRRRYGEILREEIARTVCEEAEVADEIRHLMAVLGRNGGN